MRVTISMPCFGRPARTKRAIESIFFQDTNGWEAYIIGDNCPHFQKLIDCGYLKSMSQYAASQGNSLIYKNFSKNWGGCGYKQTNYTIRRAKGKYLVFMANDDVILPNHLSHYLEIENTSYDYMYFNSYIDPTDEVRVPILAPSRIGHSEIIVKTSIARRARPHTKYYGHDWDFINSVIVASNGNGTKSKSDNATYHIMHVPAFGTKDVID